MFKSKSGQIIAIGLISCLATVLCITLIKAEKKKALERQVVAYNLRAYNLRDDKTLSLEGDPWLRAQHPMAAKRVMFTYTLTLVDRSIHHRGGLPGGITTNQLTAGWLPLRDRIIAGGEAIEETDWLQLCEDQANFWSEVRAHQDYVFLVKSKSPDGEWHEAIAKETPDPSVGIDFRALASAECTALDEVSK